MSAASGPKTASRDSMNSSSGSPTSHEAPLPVVLAGARGHGRWHLENIRRLQDKGLVRLAGILELTPLTGEELGTFSSPGELPEQSADFGALLDSTGAAIAVTEPRSPPTPTWQ